MPYKDYSKRKKQALEYYYKNKEKVLKYQIQRLNNKYKTDLEYRKKRQLRDKTRNKKRKINGNCKICGDINDLHRHHFNYESTEHIIVCRKCHNKIHYYSKMWNKIIFIDFFTPAKVYGCTSFPMVV